MDYLLPTTIKSNKRKNEDDKSVLSTAVTPERAKEGVRYKPKEVKEVESGGDENSDDGKNNEKVGDDDDESEEDGHVFRSRFVLVKDFHNSDHYPFPKKPKISTLGENQDPGPFNFQPAGLRRSVLVDDGESICYFQVKIIFRLAAAK